MWPVRGTGQNRILIIGDFPDHHETATFSSRRMQLVPVALHQYGTAFNGCASVYLLDSFTPDIASVFTTVKKHGHANNWTPVEGGFASDRLLNARNRVLSLLDHYDPTVVLLSGELALWAVTGQTKIDTCRGSIYPSLPSVSGRIYKTVCTYSARDVYAVWERKVLLDRDIQRTVLEARSPGYAEPEWNFLLNASAQEYLEKIDELVQVAEQGVLRLACDIETIRHQIACVGIAWSSRDAICVPFRTAQEHWSIDTELILIKAIQRLLEHPNVRIIGQNFQYDAQYFTTKWGVIPRMSDDTMVAQHTLFPGMPKALHFIASLYCDFYQYWKDDLKDYKKAPADDTKFFSYNCKDCCYTFEAMTKLQHLLDKDVKRNDIYHERMSKLWWTVLRLNLRGVRIDVKRRHQLTGELIEAAQQRQMFLNHVIGRPFNPRSTPQMQQFFWDEMGVKAAKSRTSKKPSLNAEILAAIPEQFPLLAPIVDTIIEMRSIGVFLKTFIQAPLDFDQRIRSSFNMCGTETFRFSSSENAFGSGANLQNIPKGNRARTAMKMPNIRDLFIVDPGEEMFDIDLAGADAQVVAWEADDPVLKQMFREGVKVHAYNAKDLFGSDAGPDGKKEPYYTRTKTGVHLTNYGGYPPTMAAALGITVKEAERFQRRWFEIHPWIREWHERIEHLIQAEQAVENKFGYRRKYFGHMDRLLPEALAWIPQSTVAIVTAKALTRIDKDFPLSKVLLQVHDSVVFSLPVQRPPGYLDDILAACRIVIPYDDPLIIPFGWKGSTVSWGECE